MSHPASVGIVKRLVLALRGALLATQIGDPVLRFLLQPRDSFIAVVFAESAVVAGRADVRCGSRKGCQFSVNGGGHAGVLFGLIGHAVSIPPRYWRRQA